ncbi:MAG: type II toxin-antitoxin system MqsA family antitoxin [Chitinophagaceae bacterium]
MNTCPVCKNGELEKGTTTVTLERNDSIVIFKKVAADVCNNCGTYFLDEQTSKDLYNKATDAINKGAEIEVVKMSAL